MTVSELITKLQAMPPTAPIHIAPDDEAEYHGPAHNVQAKLSTTGMPIVVIN